jgi:hypothetical protein
MLPDKASLGALPLPAAAELGQDGQARREPQVWLLPQITSIGGLPVAIATSGARRLAPNGLEPGRSWAPGPPLPLLAICWETFFD